MKKLLFILSMLTASCLASAQITITGKVVDGVSGEALPYVTISTVGTKAGSITNFEGQFTVRVYGPVDSIKASYVGYEAVTKPVTDEPEQTINFTLYETSSALTEIVVRPGGVNPAVVIMKRAQKKRSLYNPEKIEQYEYEGYNKVTLAVDNVTEKFKKRKLFDAMEPLFDTVSSFSDTTAQKVLPVFVSETLSDYYFQKSPRRTREVIKATHIQGVGVGEDSYVAQLLGSTFQQYNFYENNLYILDKDFISPLSSQANSYYYFTLRDSVEVNGEACYQIRVDPKNPRDLVFSGMLWISTSTYAVKQLSLEITNEANLNFVERLKIQQEFTEVEPTVWLPNKTRVLIDIAELTNNTLGMIGLYYQSAKNIKVDQDHPLEFYEDKITVLEGAYDQNTAYWDTARHDKLSAEDERIYKMVDSLKNQPLIKTYVDVAEMLIEGHIPAGKIELGPYYHLLGYNNLEGVRTRIGFRTSPEFSKDFMFRMYGAYGFKDEQFKYGVFVDQVLNRKKWSKIGAFVKQDVELIGLTDEDIGTTAIFEAFATLGTNQLNRSFTKRLWYEKELFKGYTQQISLTHKDFSFEPIGNYVFGYLDPETQSITDEYTITSVRLKGRLSYKEQFIYRRNQRYSLGNLKAPVLTVDYTHSFDNLLGGDFNYDQVGLHLWQFNSLGNIGTFEYNVKVYKTFGTAPYPSLFIMLGNQSIFSNDQSYNLMNYFEFAADQYISADYEHQFNGLIMNRLPLLKRLNLRSFVNFRAVYGSMSDANLALLPNDISISTPRQFVNNVPYIEAGYGIENIFRFVRVDFIHRTTYLDADPKPRAFGVKTTAVFRF